MGFLPNRILVLAASMKDSAESPRSFEGNNLPLFFSGPFFAP